MPQVRRNQTPLQGPGIDTAALGFDGKFLLFFPEIHFRVLMSE